MTKWDGVGNPAPNPERDGVCNTVPNVCGLAEDATGTSPKRFGRDECLAKPAGARGAEPLNRVPAPKPATILSD
jgi:hypothetical protein